MKGKISKYTIESILWEDHTHVERGPLPDDPDDFVLPTLSVGIVLKETDKSITLVSEIERYRSQEDDMTYTLIFKDAIIGRRKYGKIELSID